MPDINKIRLNSQLYNLSAEILKPKIYKLSPKNGTKLMGDYYNKNNTNNAIIDLGNIIICKFALYIPDSDIVNNAEFLELASSETPIAGTFATSWNMITTMYDERYKDGYSSFPLSFDGNNLTVNYPHEWGRNAKLIDQIITYRIS